MRRNIIAAGAIAGVLVMFLILAAELHYMGMRSVPFSTKILLFVLLNLNVLAILVLMFFVGKNILGVYLDRKRRVPGYRFKTKIVAVLVTLTMIPSAFLFIASSGVITSYLDRLFDPIIKEPLSLSVRIARSSYEMQRKQLLGYARAVAAGGAVPDNYKVSHLADVPREASETIRAGFEGRPDVEVISGPDGDTVRAVAPEYRGGRQTGVVIVESMMDKEISRNAGAIQDAFRNYATIESWKSPIKTNYLLLLGFLTLLTVVMGLWIGLRISRGITDPVQSLVAATEQVAGGDLDTSISIQRDDEIGLLVSSFNNMVCELKEGKESLQRAWTESERRRLIIENILENIHSGVISLDASGNILMINGMASRILQISPEEIVNRNYDVLLSMLKSEELRETVKGIRIREFKPVEKELRVTAGDRRLLLRIFITALGGTDNFLGTIVVFDDLTDIVRAQRALAWQEVARRIAHEIKNPLTPIKLSTDRMIKKWQNRDDDFGEVFERSTRTISREVEGLKRLVDEFSRFGKMPELHKRPGRISSIIEAVIQLYSDFRDVRIRFGRTEGEPQVELDAEQFKRVIINIVDNAIQAMQGRGTIDIAITFDEAGNRAFVDIADDGPGIRDEDKEKLFMPYFSTKKDGTGLGLAIASRVIAEHRGYIRIRDNHPTGSVFTIELPIREG